MARCSGCGDDASPLAQFDAEVTELLRPLCAAVKGLYTAVLEPRVPLPVRAVVAEHLEEIKQWITETQWGLGPVVGRSERQGGESSSEREE